MRLLFVMIGIVLMVISDICTAAPIGRYLTVANQATAAQIDPLTQIIQVRFPSSVKTVSDAMGYLLRFSGYHLIMSDQTDEFTKLALPQSDRSLGPITLQDSLLTLAGEPFGLYIDPVHRLLAFRLMPVYSSVYQNKFATTKA